MRGIRASVVAMAAATTLFIAPGAALAHSMDDDEWDKDKQDASELTL